MESVATRVDEDTKQYLEAEAQRLDVTSSEAIRLVLERYAQEKARIDDPEQPEETITELEDRLVELEQTVSVVVNTQVDMARRSSHTRPATSRYPDAYEPSSGLSDDTKPLSSR
jgi:antitoxin component of RelBE/YafQ-DinJ toxin-antitoxin module